MFLYLYEVEVLIKNNLADNETAIGSIRNRAIHLSLNLQHATRYS